MEKTSNQWSWLVILADDRRKEDKEKEVLKQQIKDLYTEIGELTTKLNWLKKNLASNWSRSELFEVRGSREVKIDKRDKDKI
jgi:hypothetical protein